MGHSRGGPASKLHLAVSLGGRAVRILLSEGHRADVGYAPQLLQGLRPLVVIADRGYDSDLLIGDIEQKGARAVIPSRSNRKQQRRTDGTRYKQRNVIERYINQLKQFRRVATRYDKTDINYMAFVYIAAAYVNLKATVNTP